MKKKIELLLVLTGAASTLLYLGLQEGYGKGRSLMLASLIWFWLVFVLVTRRWIFSLYLTLFTALTVFFSSSLKFKNLGVSLSFSDLKFYLRSWFELLGLIWSYGYVHILFLFLCVVFAFSLQFKRETPLFRLDGIVRRVLWLAVTLGVLLPGAQGLSNYGSYLYQGKVPISVLSYSPCISGFVLSAQFNEIVIPGQPGKAGAYGSNPGVMERRIPEARPDIFVWLEESTFDPRLIHGCLDKVCQSSLFKATGRNEWVNPMRVHVFGGATWNSEFALLTGLDHRLFGPSGGSAPVTVAPRLKLALPRYLRTLGYKTIALYPVNKTYLNAERAYRNYGFDEVLDASDFGISTSWNVTDRQLFELFQKKVKQIHGRQPVFVMMLTMYQHGPHEPSKEKPLPSDWKPTGLNGVDSRFRDRISSYLFRLNESEKVVRDAYRYLDDLYGKKPYLMVHFGDHHPNFGQAWGDRSFYEPRMFAQYGSIHDLSYFKMRSNVPLAKKSTGRVLDLAFLGTVLLETAGLPLDSFHVASRKLLDQCDGAYFDCPKRQEFESYLSHVFHELRILQ